MNLERPTDAPSLGDWRDVEEEATVVAAYTTGYEKWFVLEYDAGTDVAYVWTNDTDPEDGYFTTIELGELFQDGHIETDYGFVGLTLREAVEGLHPINYGDTYFGRGLR